MNVPEDDIRGALSPTIEFRLTERVSEVPSTHWRWASVLQVAAFCLALGLAAVLLFWVLHSGPLRLALILAFIATVLLNLLLAWITRGQAPISHGVENGEEHTVQSPVKVICYLSQRELKQFRGVTREQFEPIIIQYITGLSGRKASRFRRRHSAIISMIFVLAPIWLAFIRLWAGVGMGVALIALFYLPVWFRPSYLRASPELLEIVSGSWWSSRVRVVKRIDLATATLTVRVDECGVDVFADSGRRTLTTTLGLASFADPCQAAVAIVRAAITPAVGAPLPESSLCG